MVDTFETIIYRQKQALHSWKTSIVPDAGLLTPEIEDQVWELLVLCADNLKSPSLDTDEEISRVAYDLGVELLPKADIRKINSIFRDKLIDAVLRHVKTDDTALKQMIHFANLVSDAFADASSDRLRRTISRQRTLRLAEELHMAKAIQEKLLPKSIPHIPGFQVAGRVIPAFEVGGDYWSVKYYPDDNRVTMKLADISGHGIAAATLVAAVKFISGGYYRAASTAHEVIERTNRVLVMETPVEILVTMVYAWLYPDTREIEVVNSGHTPVFICRENTCEDIPVTGPVLGVAITEYGEHKYQLNTGDIFFVGSDGITEAGAGEAFGEARLKEVVVANKDKTADEIADAVIEAVTSYAGQPHDDVSLVVLKAVDAPTG